MFPPCWIVPSWWQNPPVKWFLSHLRGLTLTLLLPRLECLMSLWSLTVWADSFDWLCLSLFIRRTFCTCAAETCFLLAWHHGRHVGLMTDSSPPHCFSSNHNAWCVYGLVTHWPSPLLWWFTASRWEYHDRHHPVGPFLWEEREGRAYFWWLLQVLKHIQCTKSQNSNMLLLINLWVKSVSSRFPSSLLFRFMDNLQTEVLEIEFLTYSKGMTTISEEDFAKILLRFTNVENISAYLENVRHCIPDEKVRYIHARSFLLGKEHRWINSCANDWKYTKISFSSQLIWVNVDYLCVDVSAQYIVIYFCFCLFGP